MGDKENAMKVIERKNALKELYMEGFRLQQDLKLAQRVSNEPQDQSLSNGSSLKVKRTIPMFVWPIPQHQMNWMLRARKWNLMKVTNKTKNIR